MTSERRDQFEEWENAGEKRWFELLNMLIEAPAADQNRLGEQLRRDHPELAPLVDCLARVERLAADSHRPAEALSSPAGGTSPPAAAPRGEEAASSPAAGFPREFGRYELLAEIGRGGMGIVFKARQKDLDRPVALKMILSGELASREDVRRFHDEARTAALLRHPDIVGVYEVGEHEGRHYFAMELVEGTSLERVLCDGPLDPEKAATWMIVVARAIDYLHSRGIVHRDIKPSNILLDDAERPFVADFGLAKLLAAEKGRTRTGAIVGTPNYMSPEQAAGDHARLGPRSDVFSLGAILYHMLTGHAPFASDTPVDTLLKVLESEPPSPTELSSAVPRDLARVAMRCLEKDPADRYPSAAALADDLAHFLRGEPLATPAESRGDRVVRWARREPALALRLAGILAIGAIVQSAFFALGPGDTAWRARMMMLIAAWGGTCWLFAAALRLPRLSAAAPYAWTCFDNFLLTTLLSMANPPLGTLTGGYLALVVLAGLFFRFAAVWFSAGCALGGYVVLLVLRPDAIGLPYHPALFAAMLAVTAAAVSYQVRRIRALSRYFEIDRRLIDAWKTNQPHDQRKPGESGSSRY